MQLNLPGSWFHRKRRVLLPWLRFEDYRAREGHQLGGRRKCQKTERALKHGENLEAKVARLNLRGVSAINRNERRLGLQYFQQAYALDPNNAFTLNNMGYIAELQGDRETASFFYAKALEARESNTRVAMAARKEVEGQKLGIVASVSDQAVDAAERTQQEIRRRQATPPTLMRRDNTPVSDTAPPGQPATPNSPR